MREIMEKKLRIDTYGGLLNNSSLVIMMALARMAVAFGSDCSEQQPVKDLRPSRAIFC